jgi:hypothetical protein
MVKEIVNNFVNNFIKKAAKSFYISEILRILVV